MSNSDQVTPEQLPLYLTFQAAKYLAIGALLTVGHRLASVLLDMLPFLAQTH